eukprot:g3465.t1
MASAEPLPPGWQEAQDARGRTYFFHEQNRVPQWTRPTLNDKNLSVSSPTAAGAAGPTPAPMTPTSASPAATAAASEWRAVFDQRKNRSYYWNLRTQEVTWTRPPGFSASTATPLAAPTTVSVPASTTGPSSDGPRQSSSTDEAGPLPERWYEVTDKKTGRTYYWNVVTRETTYERPTRKKTPTEMIAQREAQARQAEEQRLKEARETEEKLERRRQEIEREKEAEEAALKILQETERGEELQIIQKKHDLEQATALQDAAQQWQQLAQEDAKYVSEMAKTTAEAEALALEYAIMKEKQKELAEDLKRKQEMWERDLENMKISRQRWNDRCVAITKELELLAVPANKIAAAVPPIPPPQVPPAPPRPDLVGDGVMAPKSPPPAAEVDDLATEDGPPPPPGHDHEILQETSILQLQMLEELNTFMAKVKQMLEQKMSFSDEINKDLSSIKGRCAALGNRLKQDLSAIGIGRGSLVDTLVNMENTEWNFDNPHVHYYRQTASKQEHKKWARLDEVVFPQYPMAVLHPILTSVSSLPAKVLGGRGKISIDLTIKRTDTAEAIMKKAAQSLQVKTDMANLVLKASGTAEYFKGKSLMFESEHVAEIVRKVGPTRAEIHLVLVETENPVARETLEKKLASHAKEYQSKLVPVKYPNPAKCFQLSSVATVFRSCVMGISKCTNIGLPRLDSSITSLYVKSFLFHGDVILMGSETQTTVLPVNKKPRWNQKDGTLKAKNLLNKLPRETRVAYLVYGKGSEEEDRLLGWVSAQLVDENGIFINGQHHFRIWGLSRERLESRSKKADKASDPAKLEAEKKKGFLRRGSSKRPSAMGDQNMDEKMELTLQSISRDRWTFLFRGTNRDNQGSPVAAVLHVKFDSWEKPVYAPLITQTVAETLPAVARSLPKHAQQELEALVQKDLMTELSSRQQELLWRSRGMFVEERKRTQTLGLTSEDFRRDPLPMLLRCVDWTNENQRAEAKALLDVWQTSAVSTSLQLLDASFADYQVRKFAVDTVLRKVPDSELKLYLLQLTQCIKFEPYHQSPLVRFLIERAISNPCQIGHYLFWHMKAEMETHVGFRERYALVMEEYLSHAPDSAHELSKQNNAINQLLRVAEHIAQMKDANKFSEQEIRAEYQNELNTLNRDFFTRMPNGKWQLPLNPKLEVTTLLVEKCRFMSSKKVPLWLVFKNADKFGSPVVFLLKSGDDLRQDILTLQLLTVMDHIWLSRGLDLCLKPYAVVATGVNNLGEGVGMIEAILDADTTSGIQMKFGGGIRGAFSLKPLREYLLVHNPSEAEQTLAVKNFTRSTAGYCVATYILGIGDRHNGNIMVAQSGHLFHIDFGHFLGHFKTKFGVKRERTPFVFTKEMAYVITNGNKKLKDSPEYKGFEDLCSQAFLACREFAVDLENLFILMLSAGMPELMLQEDVYYLREMLLPDQTTDEATKHFKQQLTSSVDDQWRRWDNAAHLAKHRG